jgi:DNA recombination protein RmuC
VSGSLLIAALAGGLLTALALLWFLRGRDARDAHWQEGMRAMAAREQALQSLIEPIRAALEKTGSQVEMLERERREAFVTLRSQIETLARSQSTLQQETRNLVSALRRPEVRGRWGELTLRRVVELAGLSEHCDFCEQVTLNAAQGPLRPDLIVRLPEARTLVIDAKTPLDAYLGAIEAATEEARAAALARHAAQVEARVRELGAKAYWAQFEHSPEFAVLFLPGDQFLSSALSQRPELLETAIRLGVIIATPATLIALLKTVAYGWRQAAVAENAAEIRDLGQELYHRLTVFVAHLARSGRALGSAVEAYNQAVGSFERLVMPGARRFSELKALGGEKIEAPEPIEQLVREITGERS